MTNITPRKLALLAGAVVFVAFYFNSWLFSNILYSEQKNILHIVTACTTGLITYWFTRFIINWYLGNKVRHIYKMINQPANQDEIENKLDPDKPLMQQVEKEVSQFMSSQNQEMNTLRHLERYRQDYVGNVAHELRTPIFNIQGYVHTLLDGASDDPKVNLLYLQRTAENIERLIRIIEDLDSIYKLESNQLSLEWEDIELQSFVKTMIHELDLKAVERKINIQLITEDDVDVWVKADPDYLRQVFINLLENSIKYGNTGGHTHISFHDLQDLILVEIEDNGPGIESRHLRHIFDRFYRVDKNRSRQAGGSGLGLSIVKHIVEAHGQQIKVRSTPGKGTTFSFTLNKKSNLPMAD
ncbi:MAG: ATP-binding protein [Saprospiraceae bacterium]|nr:ATP-binding protein [Saprospiraceae bacterium]